MGLRPWHVPTPDPAQGRGSILPGSRRLHRCVGPQPRLSEPTPRPAARGSTVRRGQAACGVQGGAALRSRWAWILQDALGVVFCLYMLKTIRLPTFKVRASGVSWRGGGSGDVGAGPGQPASWGPLPSGRRPAPFPALPGASRSRLTLSGWYGLHVFVPPATRLSSAVAFCHGTKVATWPRGRMVSWPTWALQGGSFLLTALCWGWCPVAPGGGGEGGDHMGRGACLGLSTPVPGPGCLPRPRSDETDLGPVKTGHGCVSPDPTSPMPLAQKPRVHFSPQPPALPQALALSPPPPRGGSGLARFLGKASSQRGKSKPCKGPEGGQRRQGASALRTPCPQACTLLLLVLFIYDVFFVFVTPFLTKVGAPVPLHPPPGARAPRACT